MVRKGRLHFTEAQPLQYVCPFCSMKFSYATGISNGPGVRPKVGSVLLCSVCGQFLILQKDGVRKPTLEDYFAIVRNPVAMEVQQVWQQYREQQAAKDNDNGHNRH